MWYMRLKRLVAERELLIGIVLLGVVVMVADLLADLRYAAWAAAFRSLGVTALVGLLLLNAWFWRHPRPLVVPVMFTEIKQRDHARGLFDQFLQVPALGDAVKVLELVTSVQRGDLLIRLDRLNPRASTETAAWRAAWSELLEEWEVEVDGALRRTAAGREGRVYHVAPHVVLPLAFALGASVGMRRPVVLYHYEERFHPVIDLTQPRVVFRDPVGDERPLKYEDKTRGPGRSRLILHLVISDRHPHKFDGHRDHLSADSVALVYHKALDPQEDWLPYVQHLLQPAFKLTEQYEQVDLCLVCPAVVAFALGVGFSRMTKVTACHWAGNEYIPAFSLSEVWRERLPFD